MSGSRRWLLRSVLALATLVPPVMFGVGAASAASSRVDVGSAARLPASARSLGTLSPKTKLHLTIAFQPRNAAQMTSMATAVSTPGSPLFRHYLSVPQFAQRFGASDQQIAGVKSALAAAGLHMGTPEANHLTLPISGTASQVERAFAVSLEQIKLSSGRVAYANTAPPTLGSSVARSVQGVVGLNSLVRSQPAGAMRYRTGAYGVSKPAAYSNNIPTGGPQPCSQAQAAASSDFGYTADYLASMYGFSSLYQAGDLGAGQTVAIFELEPNSAGDITTFEQCYGITTPVSYTEIDGGPGAGQPPDPGLETELDIETVAELAPAAHIIVYQAPNTGQGSFDEYSTIVSQNLAKVVSTSWGECEPLVQASDPDVIGAENTIYQEAALQGQTILGASGDAGSAACSQGDPSPNSSDDMVAVQDPTSQPFVTGVGGTTLYNGTTSGGFPALWSPGQTLDEAVWNDGLIAGSGVSASTGGISIFQKMPAYQSGASAALGLPTGGSGTPCSASSGLCREVPDVSALADPDTGYVIYYSGFSHPWNTIGGTSGAAPLWAGFIADADASAGCRGLPVGFLNPSLYAIASTSAYASDFHDITLANPATTFANNDALFGQTGIDPAAGLYPVKLGYSMATGLGSPNVPALGASLCGVRTEAVSVTNPGNQLTLVGTPVSVQVHGTGLRTTFGATGLPVGVSINPSTGLISGTVTTAQSTTVKVTGSDVDGNAGTSQFSWTVVKPAKPTLNKPRFAGLGQGRPKLTFTVDQGKYAPALKSVSVSLPKGLSFDKSKKTLGRGILIKHNGQRVKFSELVKHGVLTITFKTTQTSASLTLSRPTITITKSEALRIKRHKVKKLILRLTTTDAGHTSVKFAVTLTKLR
jgi:subtilase family serine protease